MIFSSPSLGELYYANHDSPQCNQPSVICLDASRCMVVIELFRLICRLALLVHLTLRLRCLICSIHFLLTFLLAAPCSSLHLSNHLSWLERTKEALQWHLQSDWCACSSQAAGSSSRKTSAPQHDRQDK